jgi:hypothetical protein
MDWQNLPTTVCECWLLLQLVKGSDPIQSIVPQRKMVSNTELKFSVQSYASSMKDSNKYKNYIFIISCIAIVYYCFADIKCIEDFD